MTIQEAKLLLPAAFSTPGDTWADLGCGSGLFTRALAEKLYPGSQIYAIDLETRRLSGSYHNVDIHFRKGNFEREHFDFPLLNGILMANALHFIRDKMAMIQKLEKHFSAGSEQWIIIEYEHSAPNQWEPYPVPFDELKSIFTQLGYTKIEKTGERKSVFGGTMYAAFIRK